MFQPAPNNSNHADPFVKIDDVTLNEVKDFKYLGSIISNDSTIDKEISNRIQQASVAFGKLSNRVWENREISLKIKLAVSKQS